MACRRHLAIVLSACLLANALCAPAGLVRRRRGSGDNELNSSSETSVGYNSGDSVSQDSSFVPSEMSTSPPISTSTVELDSFEDDDDDDDDDFGEPMQTAPTTGSNIFSLLRLAGALFPGSSGGGANQDRTPPAPSSPVWTLKMDILRAFLQFGSSILGMASASSTNAITI